LYKEINTFKHHVSCTDGKITVRSQQTEETSTPTRSVENVVLTKKGLQKRNKSVAWDDGEK
jgi:hypothetical protein